MKNSVEERLNALRIEHDNLTITLMGIESFIKTLEEELNYLDALEAEE